MSAPANRSRPWLPWMLVIGFGLAVWLVPLVLVWFGNRPPRKAEEKKVSAPSSHKPLILYADTWPTREKINLAEIQSQATESDVIFAPKVIAADLALALSDLGIVTEPRRLDSLKDPAELLAYDRITLVYPVRHNQPPADIARFLDKQIEVLVARQDPALKQLQVSDIAIAEKPAPAGLARESLGASLKYYGIGYQPGPAMVEAMNSIEMYKLIQKMAAELAAQSSAAESKP